MEVEIISRECIKPSSPTPNHLRTYNISLLDQFAPPIFLPILVFVPANQASTSTKTSLALKTSLSRTLTLCYPLAGKANDDLSVHCNDEGICYVNARANCSLCDYLKKPVVITSFLKFLPDIAYTKLAPGDHVAAMQGTVFSCGGIAMALVVPHSIFDAASLITFMRTWAAIARESTAGALSPNFSATSIFPKGSTPFPQDLTPGLATQGLIKKNKSEFVVRRFVFDGLAINNLKAKLQRSGVQNPTRAEVVFALLVKCIISAMKMKSGARVFSTLVTNGVNLRRKAVPPFSQIFVGNFVLIAAMLSQAEDIESCGGFVLRMREAISMINDELVKSLQGDGGFKTLSKYAEQLCKSYSKAAAIGAEPIMLNSWCTFGLYEADFGWGKPLWIPFVSAAISHPLTSICLMDTRHSNGIEAWTNLDKRVLPLIENDIELLSYASLDPTPVEICSLRSNL